MFTLQLFIQFKAMKINWFYFNDIEEQGNEIGL